MSYQVLSRKWRPRIFDEIIGQEPIVRCLKNAILRKEFGHAYLLAGTRGVGKTSIARIFAKALRCQQLTSDGNPCLKCPSCLSIEEGSGMDVLEIDGASHNGVDHIRQLIENVQYLPSFGSYKIYIIDEVHMLSKEAFNALLKTLEEPPRHVIFIFATTEPEKLLDTVLSRCQRFDLRKASVESLMAFLKKVVKEENIKIEKEEILKQLSKQGQGSVRDTLSLLEQVLSYSLNKTISEESLVFALGLARSSSVREIAWAILKGDVSRCSGLYRNLLAENVDVKNIAFPLLDLFYEIIQHLDQPALLYQKEILKSGGLEGTTKAEIFWIYEILAKDFEWSLHSLSPEQVTEIVLQKICYRKTFFSGGQNPSKGESPREEAKPERESTSLKNSGNERVGNESGESREIEQMRERLQRKMEEASRSEDLAIEKEGCRGIQNRSEEEQNKKIEIKTPINQQINQQISQQINQQEKKQEDKQEIIQEMNLEGTSEETKRKIQDEIERDWPGFMNFLYKQSPALAANLEQGNITDPLKHSKDSAFLKLGFSKESEVFYDYLSEKEVQEKLKGYLATYFSVPKERIDLRLWLLDEETKEKVNFQSQMEVNEKVREEIKENKKRELLNNRFIKQAEKIFNGRIDKVLIKEQ